MTDLFGLEPEVIQDCLKNGIEIEQAGNYVDPVGTLCLVYHPQLRRFVFIFGTNAENAGMVLLEDINKSWRQKSNAKR